MAETLFEELKRYVGFTDEDARLLQQMGPEILVHADSIVARFYARILQHTKAARAIQDAEQVAQLKKTLHAWLIKLLTGPYDQEYFELRSRIGRRHVQVGLEQFYMFGAMDNIRNQLHAILMEKHGTETGGLLPKLSALNKIMDIELAIMLETYRDDLVVKLKTEEEKRNQEKFHSLQTMVASLAHEIRNPLNSANLHITLLERHFSKTDKDEVAAKRLQVVREEIGRLDQLLTDFIEFARPPRLVRTMANLNELLEHAAQGFTARAAEQNVEFHLRLDMTMPPFPFDWDRLHQVVSNLLINALDVLPNGGSVAMESESGHKYASFRVLDSGPGIPEGMAIFDPFVTTKSHGTGLGLSIARNIVQLHGGEITAENRETKGACFRVMLPTE